MEATVLSVGKSVLDGALGYAKSAIAEEVALQLGVQADHAFISDELEMMLAFLMAAHEERHEHKVVKTWVKQVRDVAYDVEDSLQDLAVRLGKPSWWRVLRTLRDRRRVALQMKELRAKVEDVSHRNTRYRLIMDSNTNHATGTGQSSMAADATMFGINEARRQQENAKVDLLQLINKEGKDLKVISVWGTSGVAGQTVVIKRAYDALKINNKFKCYAWIRIMHPFNPIDFLKSIMREFYLNGIEESGKAPAEKTTSPGAQVLRKMGVMKQDDLVDEFNEYINGKSYLIVLNDLSTIEEWGWIKTYFPDNKRGCRIIVSTEQNEVAGLCLLGKERLVLELKQSSAYKNIYAFCDKGTEDGIDSTDQGPGPKTVTTDSNKNSADGKRQARTETLLAAAQPALKVSQLIGREKEKQDIVKLISNTDSKQLEVITVCGMGGLGKTTLVKSVYQGQELSAMFDKRACVTIKRPFNPKGLLDSIAVQLRDKKEDHSIGRDQEIKLSLADHLKGKNYLIVLDDLSDIKEWNDIKEHFPTEETTSRIIVTTREENVAKYCSKDDNIYKLKLLEDKYACNLFTEKVFGKITELDEQYPELVEEAKLMLKKCRGLPLAIVIIGGFLAKQPKTPMEWRKMNEHISAELETNQELGTIKDVLMKSYDGLPYHLKSCFLYLSIFPEDHNISRRRLVRRWIAEGYSSEVRGKSPEDIADSYFMELVERSMILPPNESRGSRKGIIDSCQVHDLMREISISKSLEENLVSRLEKGCGSNTLGKVRHLAINGNWEGDKSDFERTVDMSHIRSLTVSGKCRPFFISDKMCMLRVLDLENTELYLRSSQDLNQIGKLVHLKYLSLRGCRSITFLPNSLGNLKQLQTLDITCTSIWMLPKSIIRLKKLQYLCGGFRHGLGCAIQGPREAVSMFCLACCGLQTATPTAMCALCLRAIIPSKIWIDASALLLPRGISKLQALHTLGVVRIREGMAILQEIKRLTQLRKLTVTGINKKNCRDFCSTLAELSSLESLHVRSEEPGLQGCLDDVSSPPGNLQSLMLHGKLVQLPAWIGDLHHLVKLELLYSGLTELDNSIRLLGELPCLAILCLGWGTFSSEERRFTGNREAFRSLMVLELQELAISSVEFEEGAMPKLELLRVEGFKVSYAFSGLSSLPSLNEFLLVGRCDKDLLEDVGAQLGRNENKPVLKRGSWS